MDRSMERIELTLHDNFSSISELRTLIADTCARLGFGKRDVYYIKSATEEAFTNIMQHSYKNKKGDVKIELKSDEEKVTICIKDQGEPFDPKKVKRNSLNDIINEQKERGLGLLMIERLMDEVKYTRKGKSNELIMIKYHKER
jgi:serine/threonine-protein kinase RsbW